MKLNKIIPAVALMLLTAVSFAAPKKTLKVLAIGNSFSVDAVEQNLWDIADADGYDFIIGNMYIGGCSLEKHWRNAEKDAPAYKYRKIVDGKKTEITEFSLSRALADEKWDVVTFQQNSGNSGLYDSYAPYLGNLMGYVKARVPKKTRLLFFQTWAYEKYSTNAAFQNYGSDTKQMFNAIVETTERISKEYGLPLIPAGTAVQSARVSELRNNVTRDSYHLNYIGRYIAALTWYETLTGRSVIGNSYDAPHIEPWMKVLAQEAAHAAVKEPGKAQRAGLPGTATNFDEAKVRDYTLPDPLVMQDGTPVRTAEQWYQERRPELMKLFTEQMYGKCPEPSADLHFKVVESSSDALGGIATRKQVKLYPVKNEKYCINLLIYLPNGVEGPVPVFAGINFNGNWAVSHEQEIPIPQGAALRKYGIVENLERGRESSRWPLEMILSSGYGVVTFYRGDVDPDFHDGFANGMTPLIYKKGQNWPEPDQWGAISAWAWGLSRALDYCEQDADIDASRVAVVGHSRLGKTSLWAGATDERFALVISNCSGEGGAALSRRNFGESIQDLNRHFPHWFCANYRKYNENENELPFDQHELLACIAPRPLYVASATEDRWADPKGEFLSAVEASKVYEFLGLTGLQIKDFPGPEQPSVEGDVAYHLRSGKHDITAYDWQNYIKFADKYLKR